MRKNLLPLTLILLLQIGLVSILTAETFDLKYHLPGSVSFDGTDLDFYNYRGYSIAENANYVFKDVKHSTEFELDYDKGLIILTPKFDNSSDIQLFPQVILPLDEYFDLAFQEQFYQLLDQAVQASFDSEERDEGQGLIPEIVIDLPKIAQTRTVRRLLGNKAGRLSLNGSQKVTLEGGYSYNSNRDSENDNAEDFNMKVRQDLILQLRGTVGEKIHVNVNHRSTSEDDLFSEPSEVNVRYEGTEDEIVKTIDGGNISLSLSGSNYISYNASSEGLFGIKSEMEIGNLDITTIVGQDQAKNDTKTRNGDAEADSLSIYSKSYVNRNHYFVAEPQNLYQIFREGDQVTISSAQVDIPAGWVDNGIITDGDGKWLLENAYQVFLPNQGAEFSLYLDDHVSTGNTTTLEGVEWDDPDYSWDDGNDEIYNFEILIEGTDYTVDYDTGIVILNKSINKKYTIGMTYTSISGKQYGVAAASPVEVKLLRKRNQDDVENPHYWKMQVRNIYDMGLEGDIKSEGFSLDVYHVNEADGTFEYTVPDTVDYDESVFGKYYNDYLRLDSKGNGQVDADDTTVDLDSGTIIFPFLEPFKALGDPDIYTEEGDAVQQTDVKMKMMVKGEVGRGSINLGMNIMPGSVVVKLGPDKEKLVEGVDYIVDYDFGDVTMLSERAKDSTKEIYIDYQYKPLFAVDSKTIIGMRADWNINDNMKLGGTFVYQAEKVKEKHPKIGNENRTVILADIDGEISYEMPFVTRAIDWLPLIRTDAKSTVSLGAEAAVSLTRIYGSDKQNDKKEAYVEDMEAILDSYPMGINRDSWVPASKPYHVMNYGKSTSNWFNPEDVRAEEVYIPESLADDEKNDIIQILAMRMKPTGLSNPGMQNLYWSGLMKYIGNEVDFSTKKYIEFLVKVNDDHETLEKPYVKMHIDLGDVSEDFYTDFGGLGVLNKEERTDGGIFGPEQDIGLDGIADDAPGDDPNDDYDGEVEMVYGEEEFPGINGTENNFNRLDTEDLDDNSVLNTSEIFFEYAVDLGRDQYLQSEYNGWRLYRVPLEGDANFEKISNNALKEADMSKISFARIWFETEQECKIKLVNLDIVGNKWIEDPIKGGFNTDITETELNNNNELMNVGIVDNQKNPHYMPAPGTVIEETGKSTLEQSLAIEYQNLQNRHSGLAIQTFNDKFNLLGYERIRFWVYGEEPQNYLGEYQPQELIIRIGANETHYYEIRKPLVIRDYNADMDNSGNMIMKTAYWDDEDNPQIDIPLSDLTFLKNESDPSIIDAGDYLYYEKDGYEFRRVGNPTLSNITELGLGLEATEEFTGTIYFDDIRVANPFEEPGYASFVNFSTQFADFAGFSAEMEIKSQNFNTSTTRSQNYSYEEETNLNLSGNLALHKFLPNEWGISIPLTASRTQGLRKSRFKANSDILRENLSEEDKEREQTKSLIYRSSVSFTQNKTPDSKIMEYLIKNTRLEGTVQKRFNSAPTSTDSTLTYSGRYTYTLAHDLDDVELKLWGAAWNKLFNVEHKLYFFPTNISNSVNYSVELPERWTWRTVADSLPYWELSTNNDTIKTVTTSSSVAYRLTTDLDLDYSLSTTRDMVKENYLEDFNIGTEKTRGQNVSFDYNPKLLEGLISMDFSGSADYDDRRVESNTTADSLRNYYYDGGVVRSFNSSFTLKNHDLLVDFGSWLNSKIGTKDPLADDETKEKDGKPSDEDKQEKPKDKSDNKPKDKPKDKTEDELKDEKAEKDKDLQQNQISSGAGQDKNDVKPSGKTEQKKPDGKDSGKGSGKDSEEKEKAVDNSPMIVKVINYISRLENIDFSYMNTHKTNYEDLADRPDFWYQLGREGLLRTEADTLWADDGTILELLPAEISLLRNTHKITASSSFAVLRNLSANWSYTWENTRDETSDNETRKQIFPNLSVTLTEFEKLIRMEDILTSSRLSSSFNRTVEEGGDLKFTEADRRTSNISFSPLLSWNGNFGDDISSSVSYNTRYGEEIDYFRTQGTQVTQKSTENSINGSVSYSFKAPKGLKIPFIGDRIRFQNELTASVDVSYEEREDKTIRNEEKAVKNVDRSAVSLIPSASYKFSKNIDAGLSYKYEKSFEKTSDLTLKTNRLSIWVEIQF